MGTFALILAMLGGLSGVMGILTAAEVVPSLGAEFSWLFWFWVAGLLFLATIRTCPSLSDRNRSFCGQAASSSNTRCPTPPALASSSLMGA